MMEGTSHRKVWITAALSATLFALLLRQCRRKRTAACKNAADSAQASLRKTMQRSLLPLFVEPALLPTGWGVAPPIFYPPHSAVIPLVLPSEMEEMERSSHLVRRVRMATAGHQVGKGNASAFILCAHTGVTAVRAAGVKTDGASPTASASAELQQQQLLAELLSHHPILKDEFGGISTQWTSLAVALSALGKKKDTASPTTLQAAAEEKAASDVLPAFTHVLQSPDNTVLLGGVNGPYFFVAVLAGFEGMLRNVMTNSKAEPPTLTSKAASAAVEAVKGQSLTTTATAAIGAVMDLAGVIRGLVNATFKVSLATGDGGASPSSSSLSTARLPGGATFAVHRGYYRVLCVYEGRELELCVPVEIALRSEVANQSLVTSMGSPAAARANGNLHAEDVVLTLSFAPSSFSTEGSVEVQVTQEVLSELIEKPEEAAAALWRLSGVTSEAHPAAAAAFKAVTARPLASSSRVQANMVTMVYVQPQLGVLFSVQPLSSLVYEPWMTDLPTILYYPLGEDIEADREAPPLMSIEYVLELPKSWEVLKKDEEELRHNVLFHFTNWEAATVSSSMAEISGIRCVMFHEVREGRRCRTYIVPRGSTVLIVRWETSLETWEKHLPVFQQTLDTLHIDATAITK